MLFEQTTVGEFCKETLTCQSETPIQDLLDCLQSGDADPDVESRTMGSDPSQLVVINDQKQPIGLISCSEFVSLFVAEQHLAPSLSPQHPIAEWVNRHPHPLQCVPATYSLKEFWLYSQTFSEDISLSWAIVGETTGKYRGLLDTPKLVQFLTQQTPLSIAIKFSSDLKSTLSPTLELSSSEPSSSSAPNTEAASPPLERTFSAELLAEISHELKSPLTAILSLSNVLNHQGISNLSERQIQYIQLIYQKSQQLMNIVNTLQDLTQLQVHPQPQDVSVVDLEGLCVDAITQAKRHYTLEKGISNLSSPFIQLDLREQFSIGSTHELKLRQILVQLLQNALGLTNGQSTVQFRVEPWMGWALFTIKDQGISIPHQHQPWVFQVPQSWTHPELEYLGKTGLGIVLAQRLASQLSGEITFTSGPEYGNTFTLYIPIDPIQKSPTANRREDLVLVVASEPQLTGQLIQHLADRSLQTVVARSAHETLRKLTIFKPKAIILHTMLTTESGWDNILTKLSEDKNTPPILLIGNEGDYQQIANTKVTGCLTIESLNQTLDIWLNDWSVDSHQAQVDNIRDAEPHAHQTTVDSLAPAKPRKLTILHLDSGPEQKAPLLPTDINQALPAHRWRVVSTTTLEEAEWLANIWKPNIILYTARDAEPFLKMASDSLLIQYPFVILDSKVLQIAQDRGDLSAYNDSGLATLPSESGSYEISVLLQMLEKIAIEAE